MNACLETAQKASLAIAKPGWEPAQLNPDVGPGTC